MNYYTAFFKKEEYNAEWEKCVKPVDIETEAVKDQAYTGIIDGLMTVQVAKANITNETTDAITNAANEHLWLGAGVAGAIHSAGGDEIQDECRAYIKQYGSVDEGSCAATGAGKMTAIKYVIHAVGPTWRSSRPA